ncbi:MAG: glutamate-5-semialdehyde dehydrogenase [Ichthyobacteriaceae bacterium]|nr:glutamate-5-semialdehyde dehydrogenase [Ichthyobacteriaceae bacterium]
MNTNTKNAVLKTLSELILANKQEIIAVNKKDIASVPDLDDSLLDRLKVDEKKVDGMSAAVNQIISLPDPEGGVIYKGEHPTNGMRIENRKVPFGNILIIYESRPDVTIEAAITAFKAGNKIILKGGKEARLSNLFLVELWHEALNKHGVSTSYVTYLDLPREEVQKLIRNERGEKVDLIIPRGGEGLINYIKQNSTAPVIVSGRGNNFLYVDVESDFEMATSIILNGKSRLSVCNALDKVLFNKNIENLDDKIKSVYKKLEEMGIEVYGDKSTCLMNENIKQITDDSIYAEEFLSAKMMQSTVNNVDEAIELINKYSGGHSAVIVTSNNDTAAKFQNEVDCAAVYHNASTRFTDGGEFGFGAEIAISTQKLHFRGPLGLGELVTNKWFIFGEGQIR